MFKNSLWQDVCKKNIYKQQQKQRQLENDNDFFKETIFTEEAHFHVRDAINKQNCRF